MTEYQKPKEASSALGCFENSGIVAGVAAENQRLLELNLKQLGEILTRIEK